MYTPFGLGVGLILIAVGAVLVWGVNAEVSGLDVDAIGVILIVVGLVSAILSFVFWDRWRGGPAYAGRRERYVEREVPARPTYERRETVVEEDAPAPPPPGPPPPP